MENRANGPLPIPCGEDLSPRFGSPERGSWGQSPADDPDADDVQPLDFSRKSGATVDDTSCSSSPPRPAESAFNLVHALTPSPTPPSQAFLNPLSDVMMSFGTTVTVARAAQSSPPLPSREDALRLDGQVTGILPNLLRGSPPALAPLTAAMTAFEVTPPLVRPSPHQPAFPTSAEPSSSGGGSTPSTKYVRPFQAYSSKAYTLAAACGLPKKAAFSPSHLVGQQLLSQHLDPDYLAFREQFIQSVNMRNGHDVSHRRQRTHARDLAPAVSPPVPPSSPPENGSNAGSPDSGDDGEQTSPENSNSSCSAGVNGGSRGGGPIRNGASSSSARRRSRLPDEVKDAAYWERRRKNNEAAKRSRDARRAKEDEIAMRAAYLEGENYKLRCQVASLRHQIIAMQNGLYPAV